MNKPKTYRGKPDIVQAMQFLGWRNANEIRKWASDAFYVPRGYDHPERTGREYDRANAHLLEDAPEFMVLRGIMGDSRVNVTEWIVRLVSENEDGSEDVEFQAMTAEEFGEAYSDVTDSPAAKALDVFIKLPIQANRMPEDYWDDYNAIAVALGLPQKGKD